MTNRRTVMASLMIAVAIAMTSSTAGAQTSAPGAYYAPPAWSQTLPASTRFIVLSNFNNEAVLDRETGLVWERSPWPTSYFLPEAFTFCFERRIANRLGWRLPTVPELASLADMSQTPALPANHPFEHVRVAPLERYWTASTIPGTSTATVVFEFAAGSTGTAPPLAAFLAHVWCVRGGEGTSPQ